MLVDFIHGFIPPRSTSWQAANRAATDPQPKTRTGRSLLLRLSIKETKAGPLSATCSYSERLRSSETDWHKMTSHGNHDVAGGWGGGRLWYDRCLNNCEIYIFTTIAIKMSHEWMSNEVCLVVLTVNQKCSAWIKYCWDLCTQCIVYEPWS